MKCWVCWQCGHVFFFLGYPDMCPNCGSTIFEPCDEVFDLEGSE